MYFISGKYIIRTLLYTVLNISAINIYYKCNNYRYMSTSVVLQCTYKYTN